jgi:hypothetical protein
VLVFIFNAAYSAPQPPDLQRTLWFAEKMRGVVGFSIVLLTGFLLKVNEMVARLRNVSEKINDAFRPFSQQIDDEASLKLGRSIMWLTLAGLLIVIGAGWYYEFMREHAQAELARQAAKPKNQPTSVVAPSAPVSPPAQKPAIQN